MSRLLNSIINGPAHFTQSHHFSNGISLVFVLVCLFAEITILWLIILGIFKGVQNIRLGIGFVLRSLDKGTKDIPQSFILLTFPSDTTKSAYATEQLHILLRSLVGYNGLVERLAAQPQPYSLELVGTNDEGIRFVLRIPTYAIDTVRRSLLSYLPGLKIIEIEDYLIRSILSEQPYRVTELALTNDFVLPLKDHKTAELATTDNETVKRALVTAIESKEQDKLAIQADIKAYSDVDTELEDFIDYSINYTEELKAKYWKLDWDRRKRCELLLYPDGFFVTRQKKVYTPRVSPIYRDKTMKKEPQMALNSSISLDGGPGGT